MGQTGFSPGERPREDVDVVPVGESDSDGDGPPGRFGRLRRAGRFAWRVIRRYDAATLPEAVWIPGAYFWGDRTGRGEVGEPDVPDAPDVDVPVAGLRHRGGGR